MRGSDLAWPGLDQERARNAAGHLGDAAIRVIAWAVTLDPQHLGYAANHTRLARGYLGAVGFEHRARL